MVGVCPKHGVERNRWRRCAQCKREYDSSTKNKRHIDQKKYRNTPEGQLKKRARHFVEYAIRTGKLSKLPCQVCGNPKSEAHHYLGYSKEHRLHVVFLCRAHHAAADKELKSKAPVE